MNIFKITETHDCEAYMVGLEDSGYGLITPFCKSGSYNIFAARILGFSYPDYLRYVRDNYNAIIKGKEGYSYACYKNRNDCYDIVKELNTFWNKVESRVRDILK